MGNRWTLADVRAVQARHHDAALVISAPAAGLSRKKFGNQETLTDGIRFDSKKESDHYRLLKMRLRMNEITDLELQPVFEIYIDTLDRGRIHIGDFTPDFRYWEIRSPDNHVLRVVDVKSQPTRTTAYQLRKRLVEAIYGITVTEV